MKVLVVQASRLHQRGGNVRREEELNAVVEPQRPVAGLQEVRNALCKFVEAEEPPADPEMGRRLPGCVPLRNVGEEVPVAFDEHLGYSI